MPYRTEREPQRDVRRFLVAWRNTARRQISPVGVLRKESGGLKFWYLPSASDIVDFRPFLGFPDIGRVYESKYLWPFFSVRVMDPRRPDYASYVAALGLRPDASQLDILSRTGGERKGDSVQVIEEPVVRGDGTTDCTFLVRGARYATLEHGSEIQATALQSGQQLALQKDLGNPVNSQALIITTAEGAPVGWVPDMLIPYVDIVQQEHGWSLTVVQNNGPEVPWHIRLLARLQGVVPIDFHPFSFAGVAEPSTRVAT